MDSSSPSGDMLTCARPLMERRLRPPHDQALKCPRCESTHTKFCYYNNYSLSQPRYFCKTCRRYWTKGGTLRNIPVGGGCRKNKKVSGKKSNDQSPNHNQSHPGSSSSSSSPTTMLSYNHTDLQLSFPEVQLSHLNSIIATQGALANPTSYMDSKYSLGVLENPSRPIDFMESKWEAIVGSSANSYDFMGNSHHDHLGMANGLGEHHISHHGLAPNFHGFCSPYGMSSLDGGKSNASTGTFMETCQRLMLPYHDNQGNYDDQNAIDVKPNPKLLSLEWQDQGCSDNGKDTFGNYVNNLGSSSWTGMMNSYGSSTTNSMV